jgi:hypothetical protein
MAHGIAEILADRIANGDFTIHIGKKRAQLPIARLANNAGTSLLA